MVGAATAKIPATTKTPFFAKLSLIPIRLDMISSILFRRFAPVTPDTHGNGDSRYNSQILRMPSTNAGEIMASIPICRSRGNAVRSAARRPRHRRHREQINVANPMAQKVDRTAGTQVTSELAGTGVVVAMGVRAEKGWLVCSIRY